MKKTYQKGFEQLSRITHPNITHDVSLANIVMQGLIIFAVIACIVVFIITKFVKKDNVKRTLCPSCGKPYGGNPAKCPHCGESLKWKQH